MASSLPGNWKTSSSGGPSIESTAGELETRGWRRAVRANGACLPNWAPRHLARSRPMASIWKQPACVDMLTRIHIGTTVAHLGIEFLEVGDDFLSARVPVDVRTRQPVESCFLSFADGARIEAMTTSTLVPSSSSPGRSAWA